MAESSLSLAFFDYLGETGEYLGYGRGDLGDNTDATWTDSQDKAVRKAVAAGQRQFYFPPPLEGERFSHEWAFLKPIASLSIPSGASELELPDDFGGFAEGPITLSNSGGTLVNSVSLTGEGIVREAQERNGSTTGIPQLVALVPIKGVGVQRGQRFKLTLWPDADAAYTIKFPYIVLPEALTGAKPYSYGGAQHVETVMASCLERAEFYRDNRRGVCFANWIERLTASVSIDRRMRPVIVGMNRDSSSMRGNDYWQTVTYYGNDPEDI